MAVSKEEEAYWRDQLDREKEKIPGREKFPSDVNQELDALEKELVGYGYDPDFSIEILRAVAASLVRCDGNDRLRLRCARQIIKRVKSGDYSEMLLVVAKIGIHFATMNLLELMNGAKTLEERVGYGNLCNKFARTFIDQTELQERLRSGPEPKLMVSVNDHGQAFVGHLTQNGVDKDKADGTKSSPLVADHSRTAMPILDSDDRSPETVPRTEQDQQSAASAKRRKPRA
jgi:hypothetical protein